MQKLFKTEVTSLENTTKIDMKVVKDSISHLQDVIDTTTELALLVESNIISEDNKAIENSVLKAMDDILVTTVDNSNLLPASEKQLADSSIREMDVLNLVNSLCETTVHSMIEDSSQKKPKSKCEDTSSKLVAFDSHNNDNMVCMVFLLYSSVVLLLNLTKSNGHSISGLSFFINSLFSLAYKFIYWSSYNSLFFLLMFSE